MKSAVREDINISYTHCFSSIILFTCLFL